MKKVLLPLCIAGCSLASYAQTNPVPPPPPPKPPKVNITKFKPPAGNDETAAFYRRNEDVAMIMWQRGNIATVLLKDKKKETYDLNNEKQKQEFVKKYGEAPPPPPPPPVQQPPKVEIVKFAPPVIVPDNEETAAFYKRNSSVSRLAWKEGNIAIVTLKNKQKETYDMGNEKQKQEFINKYGEAPLPPPPPPPMPPAPEKINN